MENHLGRFQILLILFLCHWVRSESNKNTPVDDSIRTLDSSTLSIANQFLSYDKCLQRMKCPPNRSEQCSEECRAGNTEEEIEEHIEIIHNEFHHNFDSTTKNSQKPLKQKTDL